MEDDRKYRTCCCHVRTCALVIGVLELIGCVLSVISTASNYGKNWLPEFNETTFNETTGNATIPISTKTLEAFMLVFYVIGFIVALLLLAGIWKEIHVLLIPHLVCQVLGLVVNVVFIVIFGLLASFAVGAASRAEPGSHAASDASALVIVCVGTIIGMIIGCALTVYFFYVIFKCYRYLKDKRGVYGGFA